VQDVQQWFADHVTLDGKPYTLDIDQARAASDLHKNTLVTARAGSGKTRVIVAKTAFLVAHEGYKLEEIAIFMFNRTAAAEVNQRIAAVKVDGQSLASDTVKVASTFHKFALDLVKQAGEHPEIITEAEQELIVREALAQTLRENGQRLNDKDFLEVLGIVKGYNARAGQKYPGLANLEKLAADTRESCESLWASEDSDNQRKAFYHQIAFGVYTKYLQRLRLPKIDFNLLMARATELLGKAKTSPELTQSYRSISQLRYLMIDEYQDFSYLFFALTQAIRALAPTAHLFAVGDDWQAINRFAGSDVNYFINFAEYFPEDCVNIPLATNYRSDRQIVENANKYMLKHYDPDALPAVPFSKHNGKIRIINPNKQKFDAKDIEEDGLGDARFQQALKRATGDQKTSKEASKLLKQLYKICKKHRREHIMLLHRHNFTSIRNLGLEELMVALRDVMDAENVMSKDDFDQQVRCFTMHKSKGLEADVVILLEFNRDIVQSHHPHATIFPLFGDTLTAEAADQQRLIYVALTRAKHRLYIFSSDDENYL